MVDLRSHSVAREDEDTVVLVNDYNGQRVALDRDEYEALKDDGDADDEQSAETGEPDEPEETEDADDDSDEEDEEGYVCDECGREFDSQRGLSVHQATHED